MTSKSKDYQFKFEEIAEQYDLLKSNEQITRQDLEHGTSQYNQMRDKFLRLQRDKEHDEQAHNKKIEELHVIIQELKLTQEHLREPGELVAKQGKDYLREKNAELFDAYIAQERLTEKYKWELNKTAETLEHECTKVDALKRENHKMKTFIQSNFKVATKKPPRASDADQAKVAVKEIPQQ